MEKKNNFDYFYNQAADVFTFYRVPKHLFTDNKFQSISTEAKLLYGIMLDRMSLSAKNQWYDSEGRVYIYFSIEDVMSYLNCKRNKAVDTMKELDNISGIGLIEKKRQGQGKPTRIYVKNYMSYYEYNKGMPWHNCSENDALSDIANFQKLEKQTSKSWKNKLLEVGKTNSNNTEINNTEKSYTKSNHILSEEAGIGNYDQITLYGEIIKENICLDNLLQEHPFDADIIQGIYELILEVVMDKRKSFLIASSTYPGELVRAKFLKLDSSHINYVLACFKENTTKVRNVKKYLLASLFNAPSTIGGYYQAEVNHDIFRGRCIGLATKYSDDGNI